MITRRTVTDGGLETDLIFHHGVDLPEFAAFPLLDDAAGRELLAAYYAAYARDRARSRRGTVARRRDLAGEPGLGREARLRREPTSRG